MFEKFLQAFPQDQLGSSTGMRKLPASDEKARSQVLHSLGGGSFGGGVYRVVQASDLDVWTQRVTLAFPIFEARIACFGYDWLGRVFAEDTARLVEGPIQRFYTASADCGHQIAFPDREGVVTDLLWAT